MKKHSELESKLTEALLLLLDNVDYIRGNCSVTDMVGAVLPKEIIAKARQALALSLTNSPTANTPKI